MLAEPFAARRAIAPPWHAWWRGLGQCLLDVARCQAQVCACGWVVDADDQAMAGRTQATSAAVNRSPRPA